MEAGRGVRLRGGGARGQVGEDWKKGKQEGGQERNEDKREQAYEAVSVVTGRVPAAF